MLYHRWSIIAMTAALLGRQCWLPFGHGTIMPNHYTMLMGSPGSRKGVAIGVIRRLMTRVGYSRFSADKTSKERFLMDMKQTDDELVGTLADIEDMMIDEAAESFILAGEFTDFIGTNNMEFVTMLTNLWDNLNVYKHPKIHGKTVVVQKPTVNLFGANTVQGFALAFPPEALGNGFLSRVILVHGESTGVQTTWPPEPSILLEDQLVEHLRGVRSIVKGELALSSDAREVGDLLYKGFINIDDPRFAHYSTRRFTHLLKLAICLAALDLSITIDVHHLIRANTLLSVTEKRMPKALGEFGKNKNSDVANKIMEYLFGSKIPRNGTEIFKIVATDISKITDLAEILGSLQRAEKIQTLTVKGKTGYVPLQKPPVEWNEFLLDNLWLTSEEMI